MRDVRIENAKAALSGRKPKALPSTKPPPIKPGGGVTCDAERLEELNYTFIRVTATARVSVGWVSRRVSLERRFFLPQKPPGAGDDADEEDGDDE